MKFTRFRTRLHELPFDQPIATAMHPMHRVACLSPLETAQRLVGENCLFTLGQFAASNSATSEAGGARPAVRSTA